jgi:hypothetical protein
MADTFLVRVTASMLRADLVGSRAKFFNESTCRLRGLLPDFAEVELWFHPSDPDLDKGQGLRRGLAHNILE